MAGGFFPFSRSKGPTRLLALLSIFTCITMLSHWTTSSNPTCFLQIKSMTMGIYMGPGYTGLLVKLEEHSLCQSPSLLRYPMHQWLHWCNALLCYKTKRFNHPSIFTLGSLSSGFSLTLCLILDLSESISMDRLVSSIHSFQKWLTDLYVFH